MEPPSGSRLVHLNATIEAHGLSNFLHCDDKDTVDTPSLEIVEKFKKTMSNRDTTLV